MGESERGLKWGEARQREGVRRRSNQCENNVESVWEKHTGKKATTESTRGRALHGSGSEKYTRETAEKHMQYHGVLSPKEKIVLEVKQ